MVFRGKNNGNYLNLVINDLTRYPGKPSTKITVWMQDGETVRSLKEFLKSVTGLAIADLHITYEGRGLKEDDK